MTEADGTMTARALDVAYCMTTGKRFPPGGVRVTDTVRLRDFDAPSGAVPWERGQRTKIVWDGPATVPVLAIENCRDGVFDAMDIVCESPAEAAIVVERTRTGPGVIPSTMHQFRNVRIFGNELSDVGIWYRATIDENNEHGRFDACSIYGAAHYAFRFEGQQSKEHLLTLCRVEASDHGIVADSGFTMIGGTIAMCDTAIELTRVGDPVTLQGVGVEGCARLLETAGPSSASQPVTLINVRYEADELHPDGDMILLRHAGALNIIGGRFGGGDQPIPYIRAAGVGEQVINNGGGITFGAYGANGTVPIRANPGVTVRGAGTNLYQRSEGDPQNAEAIFGWQL